MTSPWRLAARSAIQKAIAQLPPDCDLEKIQEAIDSSCPFTGDDERPYLVWLSERASASNYFVRLHEQRYRRRRIKNKVGRDCDKQSPGQLSLWSFYD